MTRELVPKEEMAVTVLEYWLKWGLGGERGGHPEASGDRHARGARCNRHRSSESAPATNYL